ncbi:hypothetical protein [Solimicrobium silvestre]|uniref:Uncharacterized protein n=1 Tax=Solimicrobium silvestre TaxID=2099400 RepID=A0A2S9GU36_9BURK|nr:hypothetical protein [Solimicrobium silvestre]PRC91219.1 hypothetical protein S2091_4114 [Solimicrobium silvestre]
MKNLMTARPPKLFALLLLTLACANINAQPLLRCEITYAGTTHTLEARISVDANADAGGAYTTEAMDIGGRFRFKALMLGTEQHVDSIKLYAYYETHRQAVLLQEVKYVAPFTLSTTAYGLTGLNYLYSPPLGRELQYGCALLEAKS